MIPCTVILAAGKGKRMHSALPKVLHRLAGRTLLEHVAQTALALTPEQPPVIVTGFCGDEVQKQLAHLSPTCVIQTEQLGTGHALQTALPVIPAGSAVLVLYGDVPLVSQKTLQHLINSTPADTLGLVTAVLQNPTGLGRIQRDASGKILRIVEDRDATPAERMICEINTGIYLIPEKYLHRWLNSLSPKNAQGEYYLTDIIPLALAENIAIHTIQPEHAEEITGINTRADLVRLERYYQKTVAQKLMLNGVALADPARFDVRGEVTVGQDVFIDINVILEGTVNIGSNVRIGPNCVLRNVTIGDHSDIRANSVLDDADIAAHCIVGPFARLRPGTRMETGSLVGNFVEIKNTRIGSGSKINHLSYVGDCDMGEKVNVGAGTITCNYDGAHKHRTHIGDRAFIGSNALLVAPLTVHQDATIGAGSVVTRDAPEGKLTIARAKQRTVPGWRRPEKSEKITEKN